MKYDLNSDLAEGEPIEITFALLKIVSSASISCGKHAGTPELTSHVMALALHLKVKVGAHPGFQGGFGRIERPFSTQEFCDLLADQIIPFAATLEKCQSSLHHVKLHGALYHMTESNAPLRAAYLEFMQQHFPLAKVYALANGQVAHEAKLRGVQVWEEAFLDRNYMPEGRLVPRTKPEALLTSLPAVNARMNDLLHLGLFRAFNGQPIKLFPQTLCIHADTPYAVEFAQAAALALDLKKSAD